MDDAGQASSRYHATLALLRSADHLWHLSRAFFEPFHLSPSQFNVLNLLYGADQGLSQTGLGRALIVHKSNVTGLVDRLEKRGLLQRKAVPSDRRAYRVVLTPKGNDLMQRLAPEYRARTAEVMAHLSSKETEQFTHWLEQAVHNASRIVQADSTANPNLKPNPKPERPRK